ncbi:hypothetical protein VDGE_09074 [Verticillium dahliae]|uniref:Methyltransferase domain-containing protein n=1 Tax=Verticillium dahliae TaxID=27337 RepID=A0A444RPP3_VERDA|nr:hypothetical protein VDGE_09074 [Verticillium dahliae]
MADTPTSQAAEIAAPASTQAEQVHGVVIVPDVRHGPNDNADADSAYEVPPESTASLRSSILEFQTENGRTYHSLSAGKYVLPNDEASRVPILIRSVHNLNFLTYDYRLALCPKNNGAKRVLDMGTGTGVWAVDYADAHPEAEVIGVDLSPIQPNFVPPNVRFEIDDLEKEWTWAHKFDFIFCRSLSGSFPDWEPVLQKVYDQLEPGGYFEIQDGAFPVGTDDNTIPRDSSLLRWCNLLVEASGNLGRPVDQVYNYSTIMRKIGFVDCVDRNFKWPTNTWPKNKRFKEMGMWSLAALDAGLEGLSMALLTRGLNWTMEETLAFCVNVRREMRDPRIHAYWPVHVAYGRKPENVPAAATAEDTST